MCFKGIFSLEAKTLFFLPAGAPTVDLERELTEGVFKSQWKIVIYPPESIRLQTPLCFPDCSDYGWATQKHFLGSAADFSSTHLWCYCVNRVSVEQLSQGIALQLLWAAWGLQQRGQYISSALSPADPGSRAYLCPINHSTAFTEPSKICQVKHCTNPASGKEVVQQGMRTFPLLSSQRA